MELTLTELSDCLEIEIQVLKTFWT